MRLRLVAYLSAVVVGSAVGSVFTWESSWQHVTPLTAQPAGLFSMGGAAVIASFAPLGPRATAFVAATIAIAMVLMWRAFAANESSTSALVFLLGWWIGIPAAAVLCIGARSTRR